MRCTAERLSVPLSGVRGDKSLVSLSRSECWDHLSVLPIPPKMVAWYRQDTETDLLLLEAPKAECSPPAYPWSCL
jgi:hypothetical protein